MANVIVVDEQRCNGCRLCEIVCSLKKEGASDPSKSRIRIISREAEGIYRPMVCLHCEEPFCGMVCPVNAVQRDADGYLSANPDLCVRCRACVSACPMRGPRFDAKNNIILRCDLCEGEPACVKYCETGAIRYLDADEMKRERMRATAGKLLGGRIEEHPAQETHRSE